MRKIQFDTINGVYEVEEFDPEATYIECFGMDDLKNAADGKTYAAEIDDCLFAQIDKEYGIK